MDRQKLKDISKGWREELALAEDKKEIAAWHLVISSLDIIFKYSSRTKMESLVNSTTRKWEKLARAGANREVQKVLAKCSRELKGEPDHEHTLEDEKTTS